jgi:hypothetical protein
MFAGSYCAQINKKKYVKGMFHDERKTKRGQDYYCLKRRKTKKRTQSDDE